MLNSTTTKEYCTPDRLIRLKEAKFTTDGSIVSLETILSKKGFKFPSSDVDDYGRVYFGFRYEKYTMMYLRYVDSLAEEILFLRKMEKI